MSEETPRRVKKQPPQAPKGYRSSRRASKAAKHAKRAERQHELATSLGRLIRTVRNVGYYMGLLVGILLAGLVVLLIVASAINWIARWNAGHSTKTTAESQSERHARENVLVIGEEAGHAVGFLAVRVSTADKQIYGIAIPDAALIEVPGHGFGNIGGSYATGPDVSLAAVTNYLTVPFRSYVVVSASTYQDAVKSQSIARILSSEATSNLTVAQKEALRESIAAIPKENTAIVPLPVQPMKLGSKTYFQPQKAQVADLLKKWWGVDASKAAQVTRVILYNGAGTPGIAGTAGRELIEAGLRVVETKNADRFDYAKTLVIVQRGAVSQGTEIAKILGVGQVKNQPADQNIADVIVIVGKDYKPPKNGQAGGKK